jgi:2-succinyl-5-enolpyruvyl-6-hydroxy-3-cyclohexene-1-carboxylate synthase
MRSLQMLLRMEHQQRILILLGTLDPSPELNVLLEQLVKNHLQLYLQKVPLISIIPVFQPYRPYYLIYRRVLRNMLRIFTVGQNVVSKKVKLFLRKLILHHWHADPWQPDTLFFLTKRFLQIMKHFSRN